MNRESFGRPVSGENWQKCEKVEESLGKDLRESVGTRAGERDMN